MASRGSWGRFRVAAGTSAAVIAVACSALQDFDQYESSGTGGEAATGGATPGGGGAPGGGGTGASSATGGGGTTGGTGATGGSGATGGTVGGGGVGGVGGTGATGGSGGTGGGADAGPCNPPCVAPKGICEPTEPKCVECLGDTHCSGVFGKPFCHDDKCVACESDTDCPSGNGCHPQQFRCLTECTDASTGCPSGEPYCNVSIGLCVQCLTSTQCTSPKICKSSNKCEDP